MTKLKQTKEYVNNANFLKALVEYREKCKQAELENKPKPPIPNYIGECWMKIAEGLSRKPNFINYTYRDEMISDAIENCVMYFHNFDENKSKNPFAYFTQVIYFAFLRRIDEEKEQQYVKYKTASMSMILLDENEVAELEEGGFKPKEMYDNINEFIKNYESSKKAKKEAAAKKKPKAGVELFIEENTAA